jgi:hypothetical protein
MLAATQHPTVDAFGDASTRRCLVGKLALLVDDAEASRVAVGGASPRADRLLGAGDAFTVTPGITHRVQAAWVSERDLSDARSASRYARLETWPDPDWEALGQSAPKADRRSPPYTPTELTHGILSAYHGEGRPAYLARFKSRRPGSDRADRILALSRKVWGNVEEEIYASWQAG